jgi:hypothetical protein
MSNTKPLMLLLASAFALIPQWSAATAVTFDFNGLVAAPQDPNDSAFTKISNYVQNVQNVGTFTLNFTPDISAVHFGTNATGPQEVVTFSSVEMRFVPSAGFSGFLGDITLDFCTTSTFDIEAYSGGTKIGGIGESAPPATQGTCKTSAEWALAKTYALWNTAQTADTLKFITNSGAGIYIDNLKLDLGQAAPSVPEPASIGLVALALGGAGVASRRRRS